MTDRSGGSGDASGSGRDAADAPSTDLAPLDAAIDDADAVGFVAVGRGSDPALRYLTRVEIPDREYAFVRLSGRSVVCVPAGAVERVAASFDGSVAADRVADPAGERAAAVLDDRGGEESASGGAVLVPRTIPHDAAVHLERAGYELRSTAAVAEARAVKSGDEVDAIAAVQRAAAAGVHEAERLLATAAVGDDGGLRRDGEPLTAERLRRATNAELARRGVTDADSTVVNAGPEAADDGRNRRSRIRAGEPVAVAVAPRGPFGYHGAVARTVAVDSDGGWERRAYVAVESALDAALAEVEAGAVAGAVGREAHAELAAFGFDPATASAPGCGVGLSRREQPWLDAGAELDAGNVVAVEPRVADPEHGVVRLSALVVVTPEGYERLGDADASFAPRA